MDEAMRARACVVPCQQQDPDALPKRDTADPEHFPYRYTVTAADGASNTIGTEYWWRIVGDYIQGRYPVVRHLSRS